MPVTVACEQCGDDVTRYESDLVDVDNVFCSPECHNEWQRSNRGGSSEPGWKGGKQTAVCETCGETYEDYPSRIERTGGTYCSPECAGASKRAERTVECHQCGDIIDEPPHITNRAERNFCSDECRGAWMSHHLSGNRSPGWRGGESYHPRNYGPNWDEQREKALDRDGHRCMLCDSTADLVVHHKRPLRTFDRDKHEWWKHANDLRNLITLCRACHTTVHQNREQYFPDYYNEGEI